LEGQDGVVVEVVVVDDGSDEPILDTLRAAFSGVTLDGMAGETPRDAGARVVCLRQPCAGAPAARNRGLVHASGQYVKFLDSDDELLPHTLRLELAKAAETGADAVVSGWEEREFDAVDAETFVRSKTMPCPRVEKGIDDMLVGQAAWTAAALYRREFVRDLRWDAAFGKADDWGWFCAVCLAGARFARLEQPTAAYNQRPFPRITNRGDPFLDSTVARQRVLSFIEESLDRQGLLTRRRRELLAQYYYKDSKALCAMGWRKWRDLWRRCQELAPGYRPQEYDGFARPFVKLLGPFWGVTAYSCLARAARSVGWKR